MAESPDTLNATENLALNDLMDVLRSLPTTDLIRVSDVLFYVWAELVPNKRTSVLRKICDDLDREVHARPDYEHCIEAHEKNEGNRVDLTPAGNSVLESCSEYSRDPTPQDELPTATGHLDIDA